jgi:hypothetical protein
MEDNEIIIESFLTVLKFQALSTTRMTTVLPITEIVSEN